MSYIKPKTVKVIGATAIVALVAFGSIYTPIKQAQEIKLNQEEISIKEKLIKKYKVSEDRLNKELLIQTQKTKSKNDELYNQGLNIEKLNKDIEALKLEKEALKIELDKEKAKNSINVSSRSGGVSIADAQHHSESPSRSLNMKIKATAYDLTVASCGKSKGHPHYGKTASGVSLVGKDYRHKLVAVDPKTIPLGSSIYVQFHRSDSQKYNGWWTAVDTGSAVKGNVVDFYLGEEGISQMVSNFGRQDATITAIRK